MKKYSIGFILIEIVVMLAISCIPTIFVFLYTDPEKNLTIPSFIVFLFLAFILYTSLANRILFPIAKKTMENRSEKEGFVISDTFYNRQSNSCASVLSIDEVHGKIAYVSVHNPFKFQTADVKDLTDVSSGYVEGPFGGTRYVYYQFAYKNIRMRIPTFTARSMYFLTANVVQTAIAKADSFRDSILELQQKQMEEKRSKEVPFPFTNHIIKHPDIWSDITVNEIPQYMGDLAKKYNMHFKLIIDIEMAMFNEKCCLIIGIDRDDGVILRTTFSEDGRRVEYEVDQYFASKFDASDREGIDFKWDHMSQKIRNELMVMSRGLDSKWSGFLNGDMSWFEGFKMSCWCHEQHFYIDERNKILDEIIAWQQYRILNNQR